MEQKTPRLYPPAPLENIDIEQRLEKKLDKVKCFNNSMNKSKKRVLTSMIKTRNQLEKQKI